MAWSHRRAGSRFVAISLSALLLAPSLTPSFAFFQQPNAGPQPRRRASWPGRQPNLDAERQAPAHVPRQLAPEESDARAPRMPPGPRGRLRAGDPLPTPAISPTPRSSPRSSPAPGGNRSVEFAALSELTGNGAGDKRYIGKIDT